jgi:hypothetical protein
MLTVVGLPIVINNREMVLACEITIYDSRFVVRDRNGESIWENDRPIPRVPRSATTACRFANEKELSGTLAREVLCGFAQVLPFQDSKAPHHLFFVLPELTIKTFEIMQDSQIIVL